MTTTTFKPEGSKWTNGKKVFRSDGNGTLFASGDSGLFIADGTKEAAKLEPYVDPGNQTTEERRAKRAKVRAERLPGLQDFEELRAWAEELKDELGGQLPGTWVALVLNGADPINTEVVWGAKDQRKIAGIKTTWDAIDICEDKLSALDRKARDDARSPEAMAKFAASLGVDPEVEKNPPVEESSGGVQEQAQGVEANYCNAKCECGSAITDATVEELENWQELHLQCENESDAAFESQVLEAVGEQNVGWFMALDCDYQELFLSFSREEQLEELRLNGRALEDPKSTEMASVSTAEEAAVITSAGAEPATDASAIAGDHECDWQAIEGSSYYKCDQCGTYAEIIVDGSTGEAEFEPTEAFEAVGYAVTTDVARVQESNAGYIAAMINGLQTNIDNEVRAFIQRIAPKLNYHTHLARYFRHQFRLYGETYLPTWASDSKEGAKDPHKAGDYKSKSLKFLEGATVFYRSRGGYFVADSKQVREQIMKEMDLSDINDLLPKELAGLKEKYGLTLSLSFSESRVKAEAEKRRFFPGIGRTVVDEIGKITIGSAGDRSGWSFDNVAGELRAALKPYQSKRLSLPTSLVPGIEQDEEDEESDDAA